MARSTLNVLGEPLQPCSMQPMTGFYRNGCCDTGEGDNGVHVVCAIMSEDFLEFSRMKGNDLSTPMPQYGFPGVKPGESWCLCVSRWKEALDAGRGAASQSRRDAFVGAGMGRFGGFKRASGVNFRSNSVSS
jgi:uncharacterized protein (DUF2237 family)